MGSFQSKSPRVRSLGPPAPRSCWLQALLWLFLVAGSNLSAWDWDGAAGFAKNSLSFLMISFGFLRTPHSGSGVLRWEHDPHCAVSEVMPGVGGVAVLDIRNLLSPQLDQHRADPFFSQRDAPPGGLWWSQVDVGPYGEAVTLPGCSPTVVARWPLSQRVGRQLESCSAVPRSQTGRTSKQCGSHFLAETQRRMLDCGSAMSNIWLGPALMQRWQAMLPAPLLKSLQSGGGPCGQLNPAWLHIAGPRTSVCPCAGTARGPHPLPSPLSAGCLCQATPRRTTPRMGSL